MTQTDLPPVHKLRKGDEFTSVQEYVSWVLDGKPIANRAGVFIHPSDAIRYSILSIRNFIAIGDVIFKAVPEGE